MYLKKFFRLERVFMNVTSQLEYVLFSCTRYCLKLLSFVHFRPRNFWIVWQLRNDNASYLIASPTYLRISESCSRLISESVICRTAYLSKSSENPELKMSDFFNSYDKWRAFSTLSRFLFDKCFSKAERRTALSLSLGIIFRVNRQEQTEALMAVISKKGGGVGKLIG